MKPISFASLAVLPALFVTVCLVSGCAKRETASNPPPAPAAAKPAESSAPMSVKKATGEAQTLAAKAASEVDQITAAATRKGTATAETAKTALTTVARDVQTQASDAQKQLQSNLSTSTGAVMAQADALKKQVASVLEQYSGELETLKRNAVAIKSVIDQNTAMLPEGVRAKYQELNALLPQLTGLVDSLRSYEMANAANLIAKAKTDFARAQKLYGEIKGMIPAELFKPAAP